MSYSWKIAELALSNNHSLNNWSSIWPICHFYWLTKDFRGLLFIIQQFKYQEMCKFNKAVQANHCMYIVKKYIIYLFNLFWPVSQWVQIFNIFIDSVLIYNITTSIVLIIFKGFFYQVHADTVTVTYCSLYMNQVPEKLYFTPWPSTLYHNADWLLKKNRINKYTYY